MWLSTLGLDGIDTPVSKERLGFLYWSAVLPDRVLGHVKTASFLCAVALIFDIQTSPIPGTLMPRSRGALYTMWLPRLRSDHNPSTLTACAHLAFSHPINFYNQAMAHNLAPQSQLQYVPSPHSRQLRHHNPYPAMSPAQSPLSISSEASGPPDLATVSRACPFPNQAALMPYANGATYCRQQSQVVPAASLPSQYAQANYNQQLAYQRLPIGMPNRMAPPTTGHSFRQHLLPQNSMRRRVVRKVAKIGGTIVVGGLVGSVLGTDASGMFDGWGSGDDSGAGTFSGNDYGADVYDYSTADQGGGGAGAAYNDYSGSAHDCGTADQGGIGSAGAAYNPTYDAGAGAAVDASTAMTNDQSLQLQMAQVSWAPLQSAASMPIG